MKKLIQITLTVISLVCLVFAFNASASSGSRPYEENLNPVKNDMYLKYKRVIIDHVVYKEIKDHYVVEEFFDTDEAAKTVKKVVVKPEVDNKPVTEIQTSWWDSIDRCYTGQPYYWENGLRRAMNVAVTEIILPDTIKVIGPAAFKDFGNLKKVNIPASVTEIGEEAFSGAKSLRNIALPSKITSLEKLVFFGCTGLGDIKIPNSVTVIGFGAFYGCTSLGNVKIPSAVTAIGPDAFNGCKSLKSIKIPAGVTYVGTGAFNGSGIESITIPKNCKFYDGIDVDGGDGSRSGAFENCKKLKKVVFAERGKNCELVIPPQAFKNCTALEKAVLPETAKTLCISQNVFENCKKLSSVRIPGNLKKLEIRSEAFKNCVSLKTAEIKAKNAIVTSNAFSGCKNLKQLSIAVNDVKMFDQSAIFYYADEGESTDANFVKSLPKSCTVYVQSAAMKKAVKAHGFKGKAVVRVDVPAVKSLKAAQKTDSVTLKWSKVKNADGYRIYVYNKNTKKLEKLANTAKTSYTVKKLKAGKAYTFAVRAYRKIDGDVSWSGTYTKLITAAKPAAPKLTVKAGAKKAALSWSKQNCTGYQIYFTAKKDGKFTKLVTVKDAAALKYTAKNLKKGQTVYFKVRAYREAGGTNVFGAFSAVKGVTIK